MHVRHHRWRRSRCQQCGHQAALTYHGWCSTCVKRCCDEGDGHRVGLPVPADIDRAVAQLDAHIRLDGYRPLRCWTCALLTEHCLECDTRLRDMPADHATDHSVVDRWVVVGCEHYVTAALRAAAIRPPR